MKTLLKPVAFTTVFGSYAVKSVAVENGPVTHQPRK